MTATYGRGSLLPDGADQPPTPESYRVALERPLGVEQVLRSLLLATGETQRVTAGADYNTVVEQFTKALANLPREPEIDFNPTVKAALFLSNSGLLLSWLEPRDGNLVDRLSKMDDHEALVGELYLATLSRGPNETERSEALNYLQENSGRKSIAIGNLAWALLTSTEFAVNH